MAPSPDPPATGAIVRRLGWIRVAIGAIFLVRTTPLMYVFPGLVEHHGGPLFGWPDSRWRVAWAGLVLPTLVVRALCIVRTIAALLFVVGFHARVAGVIAAAAAYLVYAQEPFSFIYTLHGLYTATLLLACTDAVAGVALRPAIARSPSSSLALVQAYVISIYAWSAIAKARATWLDGSTLRALYEDGNLTGRIADLLLATPPRQRLAAWTTLGVEAALGPLLWWRRTRVAALVVACCFHSLLEVMTYPDVFGWVMMVLLVSFWPERETVRAAP